MENAAERHRGGISEISLRAASVALAVMLGLGVVAIQSAQAQTLTTLHNFTGSPDGAGPVAGLVGDAKGDFYGTTEYGGDLSCGDYGCGIVFKLDAAGKETVLHSFAGSDGANPSAGLIIDAKGNLYGTTAYGGLGCQSPGCGVVFKLDTSGKETVLHNFTGRPDGEYPIRGLVRDTAGNLYGTTPYGGSSGYGTVFRVSKTGEETVLHSFTGAPSDGAVPEAGLVRDAKGELYGTTDEGGSSGYGTVFKLDATGKATVLHSFTGSPSDGAFTEAGLLRDAKGNLYGIPPGAACLATEQCSSWIRAARRPCCTASPGRTGHNLLEVWLSMRKVTFMAMPRTAALLVMERCSG
jgi:uncharacterized repeat protein (TIGR03803 family)